MITRAAVSLALVWLTLPQHPNLRLPFADNCSGQLCIIGIAAESGRETIFQRLREVRNDIRVSGRGMTAMGSGVSGEMASQNADGLPRLMARLDPVTDILAGEQR